MKKKRKIHHTTNGYNESFCSPIHDRLASVFCIFAINKISWLTILLLCSSHILSTLSKEAFLKLALRLAAILVCYSERPCVKMCRASSTLSIKIIAFLFSCLWMMDCHHMDGLNAWWHSLFSKKIVSIFILLILSVTTGPKKLTYKNQYIPLTSAAAL